MIKKQQIETETRLNALEALKKAKALNKPVKYITAPTHKPPAELSIADEYKSIKKQSKAVREPIIKKQYKASDFIGKEFNSISGRAVITEVISMGSRTPKRVVIKFIEQDVIKEVNYEFRHGSRITIKETAFDISKWIGKSYATTNYGEFKITKVLDVARTVPREVEIQFVLTKSKRVVTYGRLMQSEAIRDLSVEMIRPKVVNSEEAIERKRANMRQYGRDLRELMGKEYSEYIRINQNVSRTYKSIMKCNDDLKRPILVRRLERYYNEYLLNNEESAKKLYDKLDLSRFF